jgi:hypothetical protein
MPLLGYEVTNESGAVASFARMLTSDHGVGPLPPRLTTSTIINLHHDPPALPQARFCTRSGILPTATCCPSEHQRCTMWGVPMAKRHACGRRARARCA